MKPAPASCPFRLRGASFMSSAAIFASSSLASSVGVEVGASPSASAVGIFIFAAPCHCAPSPTQGFLAINRVTELVIKPDQRSVTRRTCCAVRR